MLKFVFAILLLLGLSPALLGANGAWTNTASGGNWSNAANWTNRIIADGPGSTATFDLALSAVNTVTLDTARTNLNLVFGNASTKDGANWTIAGSSAWTFDNSGPTPTISCWPLLSSGNSAVTLNPSIVSSLGFANLGTGTLWLKGNNSGLGGTLTIARGRIFNYSPTGIGNAAVVISNGCYLSFWTGGEFTNSSFVLNGLGQTQDGQLKSALYVDNGGVNSVILDGTVTLNALSDMGCSATNESITLNGAVSGPGGLVENGHGGTLTLAGLAKSYTGPTLVSNGVLAVNAELVASRVTNYSGTLLSGTGRIDSSAYVFGGATVTPAGVNFSGTLSVSNLTCQAGATLEFDLTPLNNIEGSGINDELLVTNLTFNGTVTNQINFYTTATPVSVNNGGLIIALLKIYA